MKVKGTKYTAHYENGVVVAQWISVDMEMDSSMEESPIDSLNRSQEIVEQWYRSKNLPFESNAVPPGPPPVINVQRTSEDTRIAELVRDIYACTQLDGDNGLWSYSKLATTCKEAELAYEVMGKKLRKKESQELLKETEKNRGDINNNPEFKSILEDWKSKGIA